MTYLLFVCVRIRKLSDRAGGVKWEKAIQYELFVIPENFLFGQRKLDETKLIWNPVCFLLAEQNGIPDKIAFAAPTGAPKAIFPE